MSRYHFEWWARAQAGRTQPWIMPRKAPGTAVDRAFGVAFDVDDGGLDVLGAIAERVDHDATTHGAIGAHAVGLRRARERGRQAISPKTLEDRFEELAHEITEES